MYSFNYSFHNINNFCFINDCGLFYQTKEEKLYKNKDFLINCYGFESKNDSLFCYSNINDVQTSIISDCNITHYAFAIYHETFDDDSAIIKNKKTDISEKYGLYDFKNKSICWLKNLKTFGKSLRLKNDLIHRQGHYILKSFSLLSDSYNWELELSGRKYKIGSDEYEAKIISILGLYKNQLLIFMQGDRLVSIDIFNGIIISETLPFEGLLNVNGFQINDFKDLKLDTVSGKIFTLNKHYYYEIDLQTYKSKLLKSFFTGNSFEIGYLGNNLENESKKDLMITHSYYREDYIYFLAGYSATSNVIGVFNRTTYEIDWQTMLDLWETDKYNNLKKIQFSNDNLYVLDTEGTLRIFKKTL